MFTRLAAYGLASSYAIARKGSAFICNDILALDTNVAVWCDDKGFAAFRTMVLVKRGAQIVAALCAGDVVGGDGMLALDINIAVGAGDERCSAFRAMVFLERGTHVVLAGHARYWMGCDRVFSHGVIIREWGER